MPEGTADAAAERTQELEPEVEPEGNGHSVTPPSVFEELREQFDAATQERRLTIPIAPGRFGGNLAVRYHPGPWSDYRRKAERHFRKGSNEAVERAFAASVMVECCDSILYRPSDGTDLLPMAEVNPAWRGQEPVRFDDRLAEAVFPPDKRPKPGTSPTTICRLLFGESGALDDHFLTLDAWLKEAIASDEDDEDEGGGRPT